jgi:hypothetical protein
VCVVSALEEVSALLHASTARRSQADARLGDRTRNAPREACVHLQVSVLFSSGICVLFPSGICVLFRRHLCYTPVMRRAKRRAQAAAHR